MIDHRIRIRSLLHGIGFAIVLAGCSPTPKTDSGSYPGSTIPTASQDRQGQLIPAEKIIRDVVGKVVMITKVSGDSDPTEWTFDADEFRQVEVLETESTVTTATVTVFMTTHNNPKKDEDAVQVTGKLRLSYVRQADKWVIRNIENLTFRYTVGVAT
jgi:hypothetical protein